MIGHGSKLQFGPIATPVVYGTPVVGVQSIDFGSDKLDHIDNTDMLTPGNARTFEGGLFDAGDVTAKINLVPGDATQLALAATVGTGVVYSWQVIYPGTVRTRTFLGLALSLSEADPDDKKPTQTLKIKVSGTITNS